MASSQRQYFQLAVAFYSIYLGLLSATDLKFTSDLPTSVEFSNSTGTTISCTADGNPTPNIHWLHLDGSTVTNISGLREIQNDSSLKFFPFSARNYRQDVHAISYRCTAFNRLGTIVSNDVKVRGVLNQNFDVYVSNVYAIRGNSAVMRCNIPDFVESYLSVFSWILDSVLSIRTVSFHSDSKYFLLPSGDLLVKDVDNINTHISYQCQVINRLTNEIKTSSSSGKLIISDPKGKLQPKIMYTKSKIVINEGNDVLLPCVANGNPAPTYKWTKQTREGNFLTLKLNQHMKLLDGSLVIAGALVADEGIYICTAINEIGTQNAVVELIIITPLQINVVSNQITINTNEAINLTCSVSGSYDGVKWLKDGKVLPNDVKLLTNLTIEITKMSANLSGIYQCFAQNKFYSTSGEIIVKLGDTLPYIMDGFLEEVLSPGEMLSLQCSVKGNPLPQVQWILDNVVLSSSDRLQIEARSIGKDEIISALRILNTTEQDGGLYQCSAASRAGQTSRKRRINISGKLGVRSGVKFQATEESFLFMDCPIFGYPFSEVRWERNGQSLPLHIRHAIYPNGTLVIMHVERLTDSGIYECIAKGNNQQIVRGEVEVTVIVAPKITPFSFSSNQLFEGSLARITCVVYQGDLPLTLDWVKDGISVSELPNVSEHILDDVSSILSINDVQIEHAGNYTCIARNAAGIDKFTAQLLVNVAPKWVVEPQDVTVQSGGNFILQCHADGFPKPIIMWKKALSSNMIHQSELIDSDDHIIVFPNGSLSIRNVQSSHSGQYVCLATNNVRNALSKVIKVNVLVAAEFTQNDKSVVAKKGETLFIPCQANGDFPIVYTWSVNNQKIVSNSGNQRYKIEINEDKATGRTTSVLQISEVDKKDSTIFICLANNSIGESEMRIRVIVQEEPKSPEIKLVSIKNQTVELSWNLTFNGHSNVTRFILQYKKEYETWSGKVEILSFPGTRNYAKVNNLNAATQYNFRVLAENSVGNGSFSTEVTAKTEESVPSGSPQNVEVESTDPNTLRITWKPPKKSLWNGAIKGYQIGYKIHDSTHNFTYTNLEVPEDYTEELIYQLFELSMYTQYDVIVRAYNSKGFGPNSKSVLAMTSEDVPSSPPEEIRCSPLSSKSIYILWKPPPNESLNGILRGYKVLYKPYNEWYDAMMHSSITQVPKITLSKLNVNTNYSIQVLAFTKVGDGVKSSHVFCKTHEDVPEPPETIKVLPSSSRSVVVVWKPPARANGALTKYNIYYKAIEDEESDPEVQKTEEFQRDAVVHSLRADSNHFEVNGLKKNKKYAFWVTAMSAIGESIGSSVIAQTVADSVVAAKSASFDKIIKSPWKEEVVLQCKAVGIPTPRKRWTLDNGRQLKERVGLKIHSDGTVVISKITPKDSGNYTCSVFNEYGRDEVSYTIWVQVPPAAPIMEVLSKSRTIISIQWQHGIDGGDDIKGYLIHYKPENGVWNTKEIKPDHSMFVLENLACGTNHHIYMEAFNNIGTSIPCETISVTTDGSNITPPTKEKLIREGSTFSTLYLDSWPFSGCPIKSFTAEYRLLSKRKWITAGRNVRPSQKKLTISGLDPGTWYMLRFTVEGSGGPIITEYKFATLTLAGATIPPDAVEETATPVHIFYLDPLIFIPAVTLLIVVIIASVVVCIYFRKRGRNDNSQLSSVEFTPAMWEKRGHTLPNRKFNRPSVQRNASVRVNAEPSPYATTRLHDFCNTAQNSKNFRTPAANAFCRLPTSALHQELFQRYPNRYSPATAGNTSTYPPTRISDIRDQFESEYDAPPLAHMFSNPMKDFYSTNVNKK